MSVDNKSSSNAIFYQNLVAHHSRQREYNITRGLEIVWALWRGRCSKMLIYGRIRITQDLEYSSGKISTSSGRSILLPHTPDNNVNIDLPHSSCRLGGTATESQLSIQKKAEPLDCKPEEILVSKQTAEAEKDLFSVLQTLSL